MRSQLYILIGIVVFLCQATATVASVRGFKDGECYRHAIKYRAHANGCAIEVASNRTSKIAFKVEKCLPRDLNEKILSVDFKFARTNGGRESVDILYYLDLKEATAAELESETGFPFAIDCSLIQKRNL